MRATAKTRMGSGISGRALFRYQRSGWCESVDDARKGKVVCKLCDIEVDQVETSPGVWSNRNPDTGFPHELTCEAA